MDFYSWLQSTFEDTDVIELEEGKDYVIADNANARHIAIVGAICLVIALSAAVYILMH